MSTPGRTVDLRALELSCLRLLTMHVTPFSSSMGMTGRGASWKSAKIGLPTLRWAAAASEVAAASEHEVALAAALAAVVASAAVAAGSVEGMAAAVEVMAAPPVALQVVATTLALL